MKKSCSDWMFSWANMKCTYCGWPVVCLLHLVSWPSFIKFNWFKVDRDLEVFRPEKVYCFPKNITFNCWVLIFLWLELNIYLLIGFKRWKECVYFMLCWYFTCYFIELLMCLLSKHYLHEFSILKYTNTLILWNPHRMSHSKQVSG